jgi:hypothetical protein
MLYAPRPISFVSACALVSVITLFSFSIVSAQSSEEEMRVAVQALLLEDPRASVLPQNEFEDMVSALVVAAQKKGLSARDITWNPQPVSQSAAVGEIESCAQNSIACMINEAFGFSGPDMTIPIWFGICSAILILLLGGMIEIHRRKHGVVPVGNLQK